ncbi:MULTISPECIES: SDR family oxidoreductase [Arthrobacter]|uniref:SDR family oxidoreductase n=1 Tax=Arthrobacter jinronghuae TaxID=2964609 RepID=A0ABT1NS65_9MICC|nr:MULTISPECIES: SDR family oxidoreductase [Arthrobacter]MCQ1950432.1 SDR family oxidoreductase [Arthrobacter jinronghuae]MCQ1953166.1 SDR family oxidoreductase [Arthrobacter sp. zg-Y238]MCQ1956412.1 SDR family oxidoreductase [Arthrobacter jinronghuae]UWX77406.1 SDR family oxidoreductase [Arthrobacter jinronghuae]
MASDVLVVIGMGGMGQAVMRRSGAGRKILLADFNEDLLETVHAAALGEGYDVVSQQVDVSSRQSVAALAATARELGAVTGVVHTAGLSPVQAPVEAIWKVDLFGVAVVLEEFEKVIAPGGAGVVISSMSAYMAGGQVPADVLASLATVPADDLLLIPFVAGIDHPGHAYSVAKRANQVRVQTASLRWGARGARVNSISPGVISTPMGQQELSGESGSQMRAMIEASGTKRLGTAFDIANATAFLLSQDASFMTGADLLVDGGAVAAVDTGQRSQVAG